MKVKDRAFGLKLIAAVKREPCLYAYFYGNRESSSVGSLTRKGAWQRVANELDMTVPDVKAKWNTMRDRYRTLRGKNQGQEWFYFQPMSFMEQYVKPGRNSMRQSLQQHPSAVDGADSSEGSTSYALLAEGAQAEPLIDGMDIHAMLSAIDHSWTQGVIKAEMTDNVDTYDASSSGVERFVEGNNGALTASVDEDQSVQWGGERASFQEAMPNTSSDPGNGYERADSELQGMSFKDLQAEALRAQIRRDRAIAAYFEGIAKRH